MKNRLYAEIASKLVVFDESIGCLLGEETDEYKKAVQQLMDWQTKALPTPLEKKKINLIMLNFTGDMDNEKMLARFAWYHWRFCR